MAKVIVERPRHGSGLPTKGKGYFRRSARIAWEDQPKRERMKLRGGAHKSLNEHLGPLRRYIASQVGRLWDKIFADICRYLNRNSAVQDHVRDHVSDYVATRVLVCGGQLFHGDGYATGRPLYTLFYVCPRTGLLRKTPNPRRWYLHRFDKLTVHFIDKDTALVRKDGDWHIITTQELPDRVWFRGIGYVPAAHIQCWDTLLKVKISSDQALRLYGRPIHAVASRRASKREVRHLVNSYPFTNVVS